MGENARRVCPVGWLTGKRENPLRVEQCRDFSYRSDFEVNLPLFDGRAHVDKVDLLAFLAEFRKLGGRDDGNAHGDFLSIWES